MQEITKNVFVPSEGFLYLTNGVVVAERIMLGKNDSKENWNETNESISEENTAYTQTSLEAMTNAELEQILYGFGITANMNKANMIRLILAAQEGGAA